MWANNLRAHSHIWLAAVLLTANGGLLAYSIHRHSATVDEAGHIASGVINWQAATFSAYRVNPPLTRMLAVVPVLAAAPERIGDHFVLAADVESRVEWKIGYAFAEKNGSRYPKLVHLARYMGILWSIIGGCVVFTWARQLYGDNGGLFSLGIWCFEPNLLAHAQLATPDFPCATAALLSAYSMWLYMRDPCWLRAWITGLALGLAWLTKFTLLAFLPVWLALALACRHPQATPLGVRSRFAHALFAMIVGVFVINVGYGFQGTGWRLGNIPFVSQSLAGQLEDKSNSHQPAEGNRFAGSWLGSVVVPVPVDYLRGIDVQRRDFEEMHKSRWSYLNGKWQEYGWPHYYLYVLAVKTPIGFLILYLAGLGLAVTRRATSACRHDVLIVFVPTLAVILIVSSQTGFNHHGRYVLPAVPFFIVGAGNFGGFFQKHRYRLALLSMALLLWGVVSALRAYPHSLSYFNELAGGPENGSMHLLDSNIDWGQDLPFLKQWLDEHPEARPIRGVCFTSIDPTLYGLPRMSPPPEGPEFAPAKLCGPRPGWYVLSVNAVRDIRITGKAGNYQYFEKLSPVDRIAYSMFIYHVTEEEANRVRSQMGLPRLTPILE